MPTKSVCKKNGGIEKRSNIILIPKFPDEYIFTRKRGSLVNEIMW
jgi:hypothetical protein